MKMELFVEQPNLDMKKGIQVRKDTEVSYKSEKVEQLLKELKLETHIVESGSNGINSYTTDSRITISLNEGDILLFDEMRGFYLPSYPTATIQQAIEDISSLRDICLQEEQESEKNEEGLL